MPCCRDCKLYDLNGARSKSGAILSARMAKCLWVSKEVWPVSVGLPPRRAEGGWKPPNDIHTCGCFIKREAGETWK